MTIDVSLGSDGLARVQQSFDMNFTSAGHGPYLYFTTRQAIADDPTHWRVAKYSITSVTSPTGAPVQWQTESPDPGTMALRIGDANRTVTGSQTYVVSYSVDGLVNPKVQSSGFDEVFWNVIGTGWTIPISNVSVTINSPASVSQTQCWTGSNFDVPCTSNTSSAATATYTQSQIDPGEGLAVVAGWPMGTFTSTPILEPRTQPVSPYAVTPFTGIGAGALTLGIIGALIFAGRRGRDEVYLGLTPGLTPTKNADVTVGRAGKQPVAVQFTPPAGLQPGLVGTLIDEKADQRDVTATIVDLAVRGYLRFEESDSRDVTLVKLRGPDGLVPYERRLFTELFPGGVERVDSDDLVRRSFGLTMKQAQNDLYKEVTKRDWFKANPETVRSAWRGVGIAGLVISFFGNGLLGGLGLGLFVIPLVVGSIGLMIYSKYAPARTAQGSAVLAQSLGFKQYLETAEADQIKWEEGVDIFSRYLPFAIAFDCAERWAKVFQELAARGVPMPVPTWYVGPSWGYGYPMGMASGGFNSIVNSLDGFSHTAATAMQAATVGSSGGSGFSSGGFSGGGGGGFGGGGGGSW